METSFEAARTSGNQDPTFGYLLAFNEINWILHESTTVLYSLFKTSTVIQKNVFRKLVYGFMGVCFVIFAGLRINIGRLRFERDTLSDPDIAAAHSYAFIVWGISDFFVLGLLSVNVYDHVTNSGQSVKYHLNAINIVKLQL
jgi:hypothetical protein